MQRARPRPPRDHRVDGRGGGASLLVRDRHGRLRAVGVPRSASQPQRGARRPPGVRSSAATSRRSGLSSPASRLGDARSARRRRRAGRRLRRLLLGNREAVARQRPRDRGGRRLRHRRRTRRPEPAGRVRPSSPQSVEPGLSKRPSRARTGIRALVLAGDPAVVADAARGAPSGPRSRARRAREDRRWTALQALSQLVGRAAAG